MKVAQEVACLVSHDVAKRTGVADAVNVCPRRDVFEDIVSRYESAVDRFKAAHHYGSGKRINNAKIAGLLTRTVMEDGADSLFVISSDLTDPEEILVPTALLFFWQLVCAIIKLDRVRAPAWVRDDFVAMMARCDVIPAEALCFSLAVLWEAHGDMSVTLED